MMGWWKTAKNKGKKESWTKESLDKEQLGKKKERKGVK